MNDREAFIKGYLDCAVWASCAWQSMAEGESNPLPLDDVGYSVDDFTPDARKHAEKWCDDFLNSNEQLLSAWYEAGETPERAGMDFFLTRNGHGTGFWDRMAPGPAEKLGEELTKAAKAYGEENVMETGDGSLEFYGQESSTPRKSGSEGDGSAFGFWAIEETEGD